MTNWARWKSGAGVTMPTSSAFDLEARGRREGASTPLLNGEAVDVDAAVDALPAELRQVVYVHWLQQIPDKRGRVRGWRNANTRQRARACGCSEPTYYRRLRHAHERIRALMRAKRTEAERRRVDAEHQRSEADRLRAEAARKWGG